MLRVGNILNGWAKFFKGDKPEYFKNRAKICMECPHAKEDLILTIIKNDMLELPGKKCTVCGCALQAKLMVEDEKCPKDLW